MNTTTVATSTIATSTNAAAQPSAPVAAAPKPVAPYAAMRTALCLAASGRSFTKPSHSFDALAAFSQSTGHTFSPSKAFREAILRLTSLSAAKGSARGTSVRWSQGYAFSEAFKEYVAGGQDADDKAARRAEVASMRDAARLWAALGGVKFEVESE